MPRVQVNYPDLYKKEELLQQREKEEQRSLVDHKVIASSDACEHGECAWQNGCVIDPTPTTTNLPVASDEYGPWNDAAVNVMWMGVDNAAGVSTRHHIGWIQIGLEVDKEYVRFAMDNCNGVKDDRSMLMSPIMTPGEIDRLIKALKRAKKAAFPKDAQ